LGRADAGLEVALSKVKSSAETELEQQENRLRTLNDIRSERTTPLAGLLTMRMIMLFGLMRRSGILAQRRRFGLLETEWRIMVYVGEFAPLSLNGLSERVLKDRGQLSRAVKAMVERGLLSRQRKPGGPEIEIDLTAEGRALHAQMVQLAVERDAELVKDIPAEEHEIMKRAVELMIRRADLLLEEELQLSED